MNYLMKNDIFCNISYPFPIHLMKGYSHFNEKNANLNVTESFSKEIFSLPMYPELNSEKIEKVIKIINNF